MIAASAMNDAKRTRASARRNAPPPPPPPPGPELDNENPVLPPGYTGDEIMLEPMGEAPPAYRPPAAAAAAASEPVMPLEQLGREPRWIDCPWCGQRALTRTTQEGSSTQIVVGGLLCLVCVFLACLPCLGHWFEDTDVFCTACSARVAHIPHSRGEPVEVCRPDPAEVASAAAAAPAEAEAEAEQSRPRRPRRARGGARP